MGLCEVYNGGLEQLISLPLVIAELVLAVVVSEVECDCANYDERQHQDNDHCGVAANFNGHLGHFDACKRMHRVNILNSSIKLLITYGIKNVVIT